MATLVIDVKTHTLISTISVDETPLAIAPNRKIAYANYIKCVDRTLYFCNFFLY